ncbi:hypothetical protein KY334_08150 [Candidatus Woesearchaeota archaeon]|nr:hypothetical protein [Candidatus Woesearchaeota archaeon]
MLYHILSNRECVNLLKFLSESEDVVSISNEKISNKTLKTLFNHELIHLEFGEKTLASISLKGRNFIKLFDELVDITSNTSSKSTKMRVEYHLTDREKNVILAISKSLFEVELEKLYKIMKKKGQYKLKTSFNKDIKLLEELNLVKVDKKLVYLTEVGKKVITHEILKEYNLLA